MGEVGQELPPQSADSDSLVEDYLNGKQLSEHELDTVFRRLAERGELDVRPKPEKQDSDQQIAA